ncbi:MAG: ThiF family adenylyltransferase [Kiloniellales bacterium]
MTVDLDMDLSDQQIERYARHLVLPEIGDEGQEKLLQSRVLVVGAGGLGSPLLLYLAASGVGTLGVVDDDAVDLSNLQRQVIHDTGTVGQDKVESAKARIAAINPEVRVIAHHTRVKAATVAGLIADYDIVADGSDNFPTRYLLNDACYLSRKPLVSAAIMRFDGQLSTFKPFLRDAKDDTAHPCYRCIFGAQPGAMKDSCADVGVLAPLPGVLGSLQATEVVKELLGIGDSLSGRLLLYDGLAATFRSVKVTADPSCPLCGPQATIRTLDPTTYAEDSPYCAA